MTTEPGFRLAGLASAGLDPVDALVMPGQLALVEGPTLEHVSGLLATCAGHRRPRAGAAVVNGVPLPPHPGGLVAYVGRADTVLGTLTPVENLVLTALAAGRRSSPELITAAEAQLTALDLGPATWHNLVEQLSGGQQQRVALARAFFSGPDGAEPRRSGSERAGCAVLVLDHPTSDLDPANVERVVALLNAARATGTCCLLATDDPLLAADANLTITIQPAAT